ncbi:hypothetical protein HY031_01840 [Candidatus Gottesmanbacteria bacterium]|nr:hypothetical protein [Candidatus Gottesmanbacteria bacterium]
MRHRLPEGLNRYWYANATRFIPYTIHEFPSYSFVVSDVHGHVLSLPFVLLAIALLIMVFGARDPLTKIVGRTNPSASLGAGTTLWQGSLAPTYLIFYGFLVGVLLMTNALDGPIYLGLFVILLALMHRGNWMDKGKIAAIVVVTTLVASLPFLFHFESFVSGLAVNCPPITLQNSRFGPILFESAEKCQHSPIWMMALLWGFFWYCGFWLFLQKKFDSDQTDDVNGRVAKVFFLFSLALIIFPEFLYFKDIYPMHFRSNTMFKLGYQAFILFSIVAGYTITTSLSGISQEYSRKFSIFNLKFSMNGKKIFLLFLVPQLFLVSIYPIFSVRSYFNSLTHYEGLWGLTWFARDYPDDYAAMLWLNSQVRPGSRFTIVEADGDSYTDSARFSTFTGIPTIIGWPVHEWLWRGSYDVVSPRRDIVRLVYEAKDSRVVQDFLRRFDVRYIIIGSLERQKYPDFIEEKFTALGRVVFRQGKTTIYQVL